MISLYFFKLGLMWTSVLTGIAIFGNAAFDNLYKSFIATPSDNTNAQLEDIKTNFTVKHDEWNSLKVHKSKLDDKLKLLELDATKLAKLLEMQLEQSENYQTAIKRISKDISDIDGEIADINKDISDTKYTLTTKQNDHALLLHNIYKVDLNIEKKLEDVKKFDDIKTAHEKLVNAANFVQEAASKEKEAKHLAVTTQKVKIDQAKKDYEQKQESEGKARKEWLGALTSFATARNKLIDQQSLEMEYEQKDTNKASEIKDLKHQKNEQEALKVSQISIIEQVKVTVEQALTNCNVIVKAQDASATCSLTTHSNEKIKNALDSYQLIKRWEAGTHQVLENIKELIQKLDSQIVTAENEKASLAKDLKQAKETTRQLLKAKESAESNKTAKNSTYTKTKEELKSSFAKYQEEVKGLIPLNEALAESSEKLHLATNEVDCLAAATAKINQDQAEAKKSLKEVRAIKTDRDQQMASVIESIAALEDEIFIKSKNLIEKRDNKAALHSALKVATDLKTTINEEIENIKKYMHSTEIKTNELLREINEIKTNINTLANEMIS